MIMQGMTALYSAATLYAFGSIFVKWASNGYGTTFVSATRFVIGVLLCLAYIVATKQRILPVNRKAVLLRGFFGVLSMGGTYAAIAMTSPGRASLLSNMYPLFVPIFGALFFHEKFQKSTLISLLLCSSGALVVMRDGSGARLAGDLVAIGATLSAAMAVNFVRKSTVTDSPVMIYLSPCVFGLVFCEFARPPVVFPGWLASLALVAVGVNAFIAQLLMAKGYSSVPAGQGSLVFFWETALTVLLGILLTGEKINTRFVVGLVLILLGLYLNHRLSRKTSPQPAA